MKQKLLKYILPAMIVFGVVIPFASAYAQTPTETARCKVFSGYFQGLTDGLPKFCSMSEILTWAINWLLIFAGTVTVLFLIIGGFLYLTAAGNDEQTEKGKKILVNSVIGLVVILMAGAIVRIVVGTLNTAGNNGTTTNTTNNNGSGNPTPTPTTVNNTNIDRTTISGSGITRVNEPYAFTANISATDGASCQGSGTYASVSKPGGGSANISPQDQQTDANGNITASFITGTPSSYGYTFSGYETQATKMTIRVYVCGTEAAASEVVVQKIASADILPTPTPTGQTGGYSSYSTCMDVEENETTCCNYFKTEPSCNAQVTKQDIANRISFTASLSSDKKTVSLSIGGNQSDKSQLCGVSFPSQLINKPMQIKVDGSVIGTQKAGDDSATLNFKTAISGPKQISVAICGYDIGGGAKTVRP